VTTVFSADLLIHNTRIFEKANILVVISRRDHCLVVRNSYGVAVCIIHSLKYSLNRKAELAGPGFPVDIS